MPSKADLPIVVVGALGLVLAVSYSIESNLSIIVSSYIAWIAELVVYLYAVYWAWDIRGGLPTSLFSRQAFGTGLVALGIGAGGFAGNVLTEVAGGMGLLGQIGFYIGIFLIPLVVFYWLDSTALASRRADPLSRNIFRWSRVRVVCWGFIIAAPMINFGSFTYGILTGISPAILYGLEPIPNPVVEALIIFVTFLPIFLVVALGLTLIPVVAWRAKDRAFRSHLIWFVAFVAVTGLGIYFVPIFIGIYSLPANLIGCPFGFMNQNGSCVLATGLSYSTKILELSIPIESYVFLIIEGYFLYRSAKSLVPMNRRPPIEVKTIKK